VMIVRFLSGSGNHSRAGRFAIARSDVNLAQTIGEVDTPVDAAHADRVVNRYLIARRSAPLQSPRPIAGIN